MRYDDCEEIQPGGLLKRCVERPDSMHNVTYANWAAWYDSNGPKRHKKATKKYDIDPIKKEEECNDDKMLDHILPV